jgi:hypothetical protein
MRPQCRFPGMVFIVRNRSYKAYEAEKPIYALLTGRETSASYHIFALQVKDEAWAVPSRRYLRKKFH